MQPFAHDFVIFAFNQDRPDLARLYRRIHPETLFSGSISHSSIQTHARLTIQMAPRASFLELGNQAINRTLLHWNEMRFQRCRGPVDVQPHPGESPTALQ